MGKFWATMLLTLFFCGLLACERESRTYAAKEKPMDSPAYTVEAKVAIVPGKASIEEVAPTNESTAPDGAALYAANCVACHQLTGLGVPVAFPPLDGSPYVLSDKKDRLASIMLYGLIGSIHVKGNVFNGAMTPFGAILNDEQLAAIASYIRNSWSNKADPIETAVFTAARQKWGTRGPFNISELGEETP